MDISKDSKVTRTGPLKGWADRILTGRQKHADAAAAENSRPEQPQAPAAPEPLPAPSPPRKENYLGNTFVISGELSGSQDATIDSRVEGKINLRNQTLRVGPQGPNSGRYSSRQRHRCWLRGWRRLCPGQGGNQTGGFGGGEYPFQPDLNCRRRPSQGQCRDGETRRRGPGAQTCGPATKRAATPQSNPPKPPPLSKLSPLRLVPDPPVPLT